MQNVAYFAHLDKTAGTALRSPDGLVHFLTAATAQWQTLTNADAPRLQLLGRCDLAETQQMMDRLHGGAAGVCTSRQMEVQ